MLQAIHDNLRGVFALVILGVLSVVFIFWGVEFVSVGGLTATQGIEVNGESVDSNEIRQSYMQQLSQYQAAFRDSDVPEEVREQLQREVLDGAIQAELIRQRTEELRFRASDADVLASIQAVPAFQVDGRFQRDAYLAALRSVNLEPTTFEAQQRQFVATRQLDRGIAASAFVLPSEFERRQALLGESRELGWIVVPASRFLTEAAPDEAAIAAYYEAHKQDYQSAERATVQFVELDLATLTGQVTVTDEQLLAYYEDNIDRYATSDRRRARHILITSDGDDAVAEARARAAYERAVAGEDFAKLATELSEDTGSAAAGGDLGWADRALYVPGFADAVWSMEPGAISEPVRTEFGWHVIKLEGIEPGSVRSFDDVRAELEPEYRRAQAEELFSDMQDQLDTEAFEAGGDLARVAESLALDIQTVPDFTRSGGGVLGASPDLIEAVFDPEVVSGQALRTVELAPGRVVALKVAAYEPPRERPLEEVRDQVTAAVALEQARQAAADKAQEIVTALEGGAPWATTAAAWVPEDARDPTSATLRFVSRDAADVPAEVTDAAFKAPPPTDSRVYGSAPLATGDTAVWALAAVRQGLATGLPPAERAAAMDEARRVATIHDTATYLTALRSTARVEVNPQLFQ